MTLASESVAPSARAFIRSLNVLFKFSRLYGLEHARSLSQFDAAWDELTHALQGAGDAGLLLGVSGAQLLLDGVPLDSTPAERAFAHALEGASVASICFHPHLDREDFTNLVRAFIESGPRSAPLNERLAHYFAGRENPGITVNEIRFVAEESSFSEARVAAQLTIRTLGADADRVQDWFSSPEKMIQLIAAAEGAHEHSGATGGAAGPGLATGAMPVGGITNARGVPTATPATGAADAGSAINIGSLGQTEIEGLLRLIGQFGETKSEGTTAKPAQEAWRKKLADLPLNAQGVLRQALAQVAAHTPSAKLDEATLLRLAEDLAIRFALERFQKGEVKVNAVRQMLDRMSGELTTLRRLLKAREEKMASAGMSIESHADVLDRQFWASVPDSGKRAVLTSHEAWCIPPRNVQQYVEELLGRGESDAAADVLLKYAACVRDKNSEARKRAAIGLGQLAELYSKAANQRLQDALMEIGNQLLTEKDPELQTLLGAAFVRLSQEAAQRRYFRALHQALDALADLEETRPTWARSLRPRIGAETRLPEFVEEALAAEAVPEGLAGVLMRIPQAAGEHLAVRLARANRKTERDNIVQLAKCAGGGCARHLKEIFKNEAPAKAAAVVGLLSRLDSFALEDLFPQRLRQGGRNFQDVVVRQLAIGGAPERGQLLARSIELFDPAVAPMALDEIGMCGDVETAPKLLRIATGDLLPPGSDYLRVKAIEALGRLRAQSAAGHLRAMVESRKTFGWAEPEEIRMAAAQALLKLDPSWIENFLPQSGLDENVIAFAPLDPMPEKDVVRYRRHRRVRLPRNVAAVIASPRGKVSSSISVLSLEGGLLSGDVQLAVGTQATLKIPAGLRSISMQAVVRFVRSRQAGFEMVSMELEDRAKLRRLLVSLGSEPTAP